MQAVTLSAGLAAASGAQAILPTDEMIKYYKAGNETIMNHLTTMMSTTRATIALSGAYCERQPGGSRQDTVDRAMDIVIQQHRNDLVARKRDFTYNYAMAVVEDCARQSPNNARTQELQKLIESRH